MVAGQENEQRALPGLGGDWSGYVLIGSITCTLLEHHYDTDSLVALLVTCYTINIIQMLLVTC